MRILRITVSVLFVIILIVFSLLKIQQHRHDTSYPIINIEEDILSVSINASNEDILQGITAYDEKDGDITSKIIIESISHFTEPGVCIVNYAVCDNDNHASSASRKIIYTDYTSPRFTLSGPLLFGVSQNINIRKLLGAVDSIDGDISDKVIITANEYASYISGVNYISAKVTNSKGDTISLRLPVYVEELNLSAIDITLENYMVYLNVGDKFDIMENIVSVVDTNGKDLTDKIQTDTNLNLSEAGIYEVHYRVSDSLGHKGHSILTVIVEE